MIVNPTSTGWEVIYHRAHALLAAQIAGQWRRDKSPVRLYETVAAISHHDDLEREWEENNLSEAGAPLDFTLGNGDDDSLKPLVQLAERARYRGRWVALLISRHISRLNEVKRGQSPEMDQFLDQQLENQERWRQELELSKDEVDAAYAFLDFCDRLSLILCQRQLPADERLLEITKGPDGQRYNIVQRADELLTVQPWCFQDDRFTVNVEACDLHQLKFESNEELTQSLQTASIKILDWTFVKA